MNIVVVGLGSMGCRRVRLILSLGKHVVLGVDSSEQRRVDAHEKYSIETFESLEAALRNHEVDCAIISTSPLSHKELIKECLSHDLHVFTEINLVSDGYKENMDLAKQKGKVLFLSSTFLYRNETCHIIKTVNGSASKLNYTYHVGQYLPDWHPWESYTSYFVGNNRTNGCREIFAIEFPWILSAFGPIKSINVQKGNLSNLEIEFPDNYQLLVEHENGNKGTISVDVVSRKPVRRLEVYGEELYLTWNGTPESVVEYDYLNKCDKSILFYESEKHEEGYASFITESPYLEEIKSFFDCIEDRTKFPRWDFPRDEEVIQWIDQIERKE